MEPSQEQPQQAVQESVAPPQEVIQSPPPLDVLSDQQQKSQVLKYGLLAFAGAIVALSIAGIAISNTMKQKNNVPLHTETSPTEILPSVTGAIPTVMIEQSVSCQDVSDSTPNTSLPPMLNKEKYRGSPTNYPSDWPAVLRYPKEFLLMDPVSGSLEDLTGDSSKGYAAALLYNGSASNAVQLMGEFMKSNGYTLECVKMESWKYLLVVDKNHKGGAITFEEDLEGQNVTRIIATVFPE